MDKIQKVLKRLFGIEEKPVWRYYDGDKVTIIKRKTGKLLGIAFCFMAFVAPLSAQGTYEHSYVQPVRLARSTSPVETSLPKTNYDSFGRMRIASPYSIFESQFEYSGDGELWISSTAGSGAITHRPNESSLLMTVGAGATDRAVQQSRVYHRYQPGKSQLIMMTGVLGNGTANRKKRIGYFDDYNGVFFESRIDGLYVVIRSSSSGSIVENAVSSNSFNGDRLDGSGHGGVSISLSSSAIYWIDIEWLGVGDVRFGVVHDHTLVLAHTIKHVNKFSYPYMSTANLPNRYEIVNTAAASGTDSLRAICSSVFNEGGQDVFSTHYSTGLASSVKSVTSRVPVLAIRPRLAFNGKVFRGQVKPTSVELYSSAAQNMFFEVIVTSSPITGASWVPISPQSAVESDRSASAIPTNYRSLGSIYTVGATQRTASLPIESRSPLVIDFGGLGSDTLVVMAESLGAASNIGASIVWEEIK